MTRQQKRAQIRRLAKDIEKAKRAGLIKLKPKAKPSLLTRIKGRLFGESRDHL